MFDFHHRGYLRAGSKAAGKAPHPDRERPSRQAIRAAGPSGTERGASSGGTALDDPPSVKMGRQGESLSFACHDGQGRLPSILARALHSFDQSRALHIL